MTYSHERTFTLLYNDCDEWDILRPSALLSYAQEAAGSSAEELGFGYGTLKEAGCGFITSATSCKIFKPIRAGEQITLSTYPVTPRHVILERDYEVKNGAGEAVAAIATRWCIFDFSAQKIILPDRLKAHASCPYRSDRVFEPDYKPRGVIEDEREVYLTTVRNSLCDHFHHVNNAKYLDLFLDCLPREALENRRVAEFCIAYMRQIHAGEQVRLLMNGGEEEYYLEARVGQEKAAKMSVRLTAI